MAIDLSELTYDEDFCTTFTIEKQGQPIWGKGRMTLPAKAQVSVIGIVSPSSAEDVEMLEEGDRKHGLKTFYTNMEYMETSDLITLADVLIWNGKRYKVLHVFDYRPNGYCKAIADLLGGEESGNDTSP